MSGPRMIPEYRKQYSFGGEGQSTPSTKKERVERLLSLPAVLARGFRDDLVEFDPESDPPVLVWKADRLEYLDEVDLMMITNVLENRRGEQTKKF